MDVTLQGWRKRREKKEDEKERERRERSYECLEFGWKAIDDLP